MRVTRKESEHNFETHPSEGAPGSRPGPLPTLSSWQRICCRILSFSCSVRSRSRSRAWAISTLASSRARWYSRSVSSMSEGR